MHYLTKVTKKAASTKIKSSQSLEKTKSYMFQVSFKNSTFINPLKTFIKISSRKFFIILGVYGLAAAAVLITLQGQIKDQIVCMPISSSTTFNTPIADFAAQYCWNADPEINSLNRSCTPSSEFSGCSYLLHADLSVTQNPYFSD